MYKKKLNKQLLSFHSIKLLLLMYFLVIMGFQLLVIHSFYVEEKLVEETNYSTLCSELSQMQQPMDDELQNEEIAL